MKDGTILTVILVVMWLGFWSFVYYIVTLRHKLHGVEKKLKCFEDMFKPSQHYIHKDSNNDQV